MPIQRRDGVYNLAFSVAFREEADIREVFNCGFPIRPQEALKPSRIVVGLTAHESFNVLPQVRELGFKIR